MLCSFLSRSACILCLALPHALACRITASPHCLLACSPGSSFMVHHCRPGAGLCMSAQQPAHTMHSTGRCPHADCAPHPETLLCPRVPTSIDQATRMTPGFVTSSVVRAQHTKYSTYTRIWAMNRRLIPRNSPELWQRWQNAHPRRRPPGATSLSARQSGSACSPSHQSYHVTLKCWSLSPHHVASRHRSGESHTLPVDAPAIMARLRACSVRYGRKD